MNYALFVEYEGILLGEYSKIFSIIPNPFARKDYSKTNFTFHL